MAKPEKILIDCTKKIAGRVTLTNAEIKDMQERHEKAKNIKIKTPESLEEKIRRIVKEELKNMN